MKWHKVEPFNFFYCLSTEEELKLWCKKKKVDFPEIPDNSCGYACVSGSFHLFNPASTTYVKHFISNTSTYRNDIQMNYNCFVAGYGNTTSAINAIRFKFDTGNIDDGTILMYGIV